MDCSKTTAGLVVLTLLVAGCGADSGATTDTKTAPGTSVPAVAGTGLDREHLMVEMNNICGRAASKIVPLSAQAKTQDAARELFPKLIPLVAEQNRALSALEPAAELKADYAAFMQAEDNALAMFRQVEAEDKTDRKKAQRDADQLTPLADRVSAAAQKLGATQCN